MYLGRPLSEPYANSSEGIADCLPREGLSNPRDEMLSSSAPTEPFAIPASGGRRALSRL